MSPTCKSRPELRLFLALAVSAVAVAGFGVAQAVTYQVDLAASALGAPSAPVGAPPWAVAIIQTWRAPDRGHQQQANLGGLPQ